MYWSWHKVIGLLLYIYITITKRVIIVPYQPKRYKTTPVDVHRQYREAYDKKRGTSSQRGYDAAWQVVRLQHLQDYPLCVECLKRYIFTPAVDVHHIIKLAERPDLRDVSSNLMSLCHSCHSKFTAAGK